MADRSHRHQIGTWPVYELPMKFSKTPAHIGGRGDGEDNMWVLTELLGRSSSGVERLAEEGVIWCSTSTD
jgi:hypothetical protein